MPVRASSVSVELCPCAAGKSLRYGEVTLNHHPDDGVTISLSCSECKPIPILTYDEFRASLLVKQLDHSVSSMYLLSIFSQFGRVISCKVWEENGQSLGLGFVQFDSEESATVARRALHDSHLRGNKLIVLTYSENIDKFTKIFDCMMDETEKMSSEFGKSLTSYASTDSSQTYSTSSDSSQELNNGAEKTMKGCKAAESSSKVAPTGGLTAAIFGAVSILGKLLMRFLRMSYWSHLIRLSGAGA